MRCLRILSVISAAAASVASAAQEQAPFHESQTSIAGMPLLGFGTWNLRERHHNASKAVSVAIRTGYRHIDCAAAYENQKDVGRGLHHGMRKAGISRNELWITSKLWNDHHNPSKVEPALDKTLSDLGLDYLDLYLMHWPVAQSGHRNREDYIETWEAMTRLLETGKTRFIGICNFSPAQLTDLLDSTDHPPSVHQMEMHPYLQQWSWLAFHQAHGIHVTGYSPLGNMNPTYDYNDVEPLDGDDDDIPLLLDNPVLHHIAKERGCTPAQVALAWGMRRGTSVIPKSQHVSYIRENFKSAQCELEHKDMETLAALGKKSLHRFNNPSEYWGVKLFDGLDGA